MSFMDNVGDSFAWPFQSPGWFGKMVLQGLIAIIPIIGWIALVGWMMVTIDNFRAGRREVAPAGFHLSRGAALFLVLLVYGIVFAIPGGIFRGIGGASNSAGPAALANLIDLALRLFLTFMSPAIILYTYRGGLAAGFDLNGIWQTLTLNTSTTMMAALVILAADVIAGLGALLCLVGLLFTVPYGLAVNAGAVTWFERAVSGPAPAPPPPTQH
jgi:hypothetical protein